MNKSKAWPMGLHLAELDEKDSPVAPTAKAKPVAAAGWQTLRGSNSIGRSEAKGRAKPDRTEQA